MYHLLETNFAPGVDQNYTGLFTVDGTGRLLKYSDLDAIRFFTSGDYTPAH